MLPIVGFPCGHHASTREFVRPTCGRRAAKTAVRDRLLTARATAFARRGRRVRTGDRRPPARRAGGTPGRDRRGVRLDQRRARHRPAARSAGRRRQAGAAAGAAARRRPGLGGATAGPTTCSPARLGLLEPDGERLGVDAIATADVVLVPGLAVAADGMRLGRGGGSYDRALRPGAGRHLHLRAALRRRGRRRGPGRAARPAGAGGGVRAGVDESSRRPPVR